MYKYLSFRRCQLYELQIRGAKYSSALDKYTAELVLEDEPLGTLTEWTFTKHIEITWKTKASRIKFMSWFDKRALSRHWPEMPCTTKLFRWVASRYWLGSKSDTRTVALLAQQYYIGSGVTDDIPLLPHEAVEKAKSVRRLKILRAQTGHDADLVVAISGPMQAELYEDHGESSLKPKWVGTPYICQSALAVSELKRTDSVPGGLSKCPVICGTEKATLDGEYYFGTQEIATAFSVQDVRYNDDLSECTADIFLRGKKVANWSRKTFGRESHISWIDSEASQAAAREEESVLESRLDALVDRYWFENLDQDHAKVLIARRLALNEGRYRPGFGARSPHLRGDSNFDYFMDQLPMNEPYIFRSDSENPGHLVCAVWELEFVFISWLLPGQRDLALEWMTYEGYEDGSESMTSHFRGARLYEDGPINCPHLASGAQLQ